MKTPKNLTVIAALTMTMLTTACQDSDIYDPTKVRDIAPAENPFGTGFQAPVGFDWSTSTTVRLNVEVKDQFNGQYGYLIELFTSYPYFDTSAPIAAGYANKNQNYTTEICIPKTISTLYIRKTDPRNRKAVYEYAVPQNEATLNCRLYYIEANTRTIGTSGWDDGSVAGKIGTYNAESQTDIGNMTENYSFEVGTSDQLVDGSVFVIKAGETFSAPITVENYTTKSATVIVKGTWNMTSTPQGLHIYVADGGKITGTPFLGDACTLEIQSGGSLDCTTFGTQTDIPIKNFGTISVEGACTFNTGSNIFNAAGSTLTAGNFNCGQSKIVIRNFGTMNVGSLKNVNSGVIYNAEDASMDVNGNVDATSCQILNHGEMDITGTIQTNSNLATIVANYSTGTLIADAIKGGGIFINDNYMEVNTFDVNSHTEAKLYSNCTFIAKQTFKFTHLILDHGSITGAHVGDTWNSVPVESYNSGSVTLNNGSIIKATTFKCGSPLNITATGTLPSMIQATEITYCWTTILKGNLQLDVDKEVNGPVKYDWGWSQGQCNKEETIVTTIPSGTAIERIETCAGEIYPGYSGSESGTPPAPTILIDDTGYTYAFEDMWPIYGDYDMNDVVLSIDQLKFTVDTESQNVLEAKITGRVRAVGAEYTSGCGIQFLGLSNNITASALTLNGTATSFEEKNNHPTVIITDNAHNYLDSGRGNNKLINTVSGGYTHAAQSFEIVMKFEDQSIKREAFNIDKLDVFIYCMKNAYVPQRREVHMANYSPTVWGDQSYSGASNDNGGGKFVSNEGLAWAFRIPSKDWRWPQEYNMITDVYKDFEGWITSGGTKNVDWWTSGNIDSSLLY